MSPAQIRSLARRCYRVSRDSSPGPSRPRSQSPNDWRCSPPSRRRSVPSMWSPPRPGCRSGRRSSRSSGRLRSMRFLNSVRRSSAARCPRRMSTFSSARLAGSTLRSTNGSRRVATSRRRRPARHPGRVRPHRARRSAAIEAGRRARRLRQQKQATYLKTWVDQTSGMWCIRGEFDPETGARLHNRLTATVEKLFHDATPRPRRAIRSTSSTTFVRSPWLPWSMASGAKSNGVDMSILIDATTLMHGVHDCSVIDCGLPIDLPIETIRRMACIAEITPIIVGADGVKLYLGRHHTPGDTRAAASATSDVPHVRGPGLLRRLGQRRHPPHQVLPQPRADRYRQPAAFVREAPSLRPRGWLAIHTGRPTAPSPSPFPTARRCATAHPRHSPHERPQNLAPDQEDTPMKIFVSTQSTKATCLGISRSCPTASLSVGTHSSATSRRPTGRVAGAAEPSAASSATRVRRRRWSSTRR